MDEFLVKNDPCRGTYLLTKRSSIVLLILGLRNVSLSVINSMTIQFLGIRSNRGYVTVTITHEILDMSIRFLTMLCETPLNIKILLETFLNPLMFH